jgi:hypothetical protein
VRVHFQSIPVGVVSSDRSSQLGYPLGTGITETVAIKHLMSTFDDALWGCGQRLADFEPNNFCTGRSAALGRLEDLHDTEGWNI